MSDVSFSTFVTREHFATIAEECAVAARAGEFFVNDVNSYVASERRAAVAHRRGDYDNTFTSLQYKHYIETGLCVALLPLTRPGAS